MGTRTAALLCAGGVVMSCADEEPASDPDETNRGAVTADASSYRIEGRTVDMRDPVAAERWAEGVCRDLTVAEIAKGLGTEPSERAILRELSRGASPPSRRVIVDACRRVLRKDAGD